MPILIRGDRLCPTTRAQVLEAFGYRWTVENEQRAREWIGDSLPYVDVPPFMSDMEWVRLHAFYVNADGRLSDATHLTHCEPASAASDPACACCGWTIRPQDSAHQVKGTNTLHCDMCSSGYGACCTARAFHEKL